jgi:hypothetical protein
MAFGDLTRGAWARSVDKRDVDPDVAEELGDASLTQSLIERDVVVRVHEVDRDA